MPSDLSSAETRCAAGSDLGSSFRDEPFAEIAVSCATAGATTPVRVERRGRSRWPMRDQRVGAVAPRAMGSIIPVKLASWRGRMPYYSQSERPPMPIYEYRCTDCDTKFDALVRSLAAADTVSCASCSGDNVRRLVSSFATPGGFDDQMTANDFKMSSSGGCCGGSCG